MSDGGLLPWNVHQLLQVVTKAAQVGVHEQPTRKQQPTNKSNKSINNNLHNDDTTATTTPKPTTPATMNIVKVTEAQRKPDPEPELVEEKEDDCVCAAPVVEVPEHVIEPKQHAYENDWELLSERASTSSFGGSASKGGVFITHVGSVRSINSIDHETHTSSKATLSVPFKIQRTASSSTIDSQDNALGPSGKGVLGVDYVEHIILPTDTLQGICIAYKVSASNLRRANHFTGHSLHSAPKKLLIPLSKQALRAGFIRIQDTDTKEYKLHYFQAEYPDMSPTEAKAYLELADWELKEALLSAKEDREWQKEDGEALKAGQIDVKVNFKGGRPYLRMKGTGHSPARPKGENTKQQQTEENQDTMEVDTPKPKQKVVVHSKLPAIATKSVFAEDLYNAAPEHSSFGLELKPLPKRDPPSN